MKKARVLMADSHNLMLEASKFLLEPTFEIVGTVNDTKSLLEAAASTLARSDPFGARQHCTKFLYRSARAYQGPKELTLSNLEA